MSDGSWLWIVFTLVAAAAQTLRNATQRQLTAALGTAGATQVRFLFGVPFGLLFLLAALLATGAPLPHPDRRLLALDPARRLGADLRHRADAGRDE